MKKENTWLDFQINTLGSTTAGFIGRTICHPIDTLKSRLQSLEYSSYNSISQILKSTFHEEGWKGLYRGYGIVTFGGIPGVCIYLTSYEVVSFIKIMFISKFDYYLRFQKIIFLKYQIMYLHLLRIFVVV